jgi:hypothetical protein
MLNLGTGTATNRHARRKVAAIVRHDPALTLTKTLTTLAHTRLTTKLRHFGNTLSARHETALMRMLGGFSLLASRQMPGRYAYALDTGCGKTQGVVAWLAAVHELSLPYSVAVAASKVEALCSLKRDLLAAGVPATKIGLWHTFPASGSVGAASEPANADSTNHESFQFLLVTHTRVRGTAGRFGDGKSLSLSYRGRDRDLVIHDESLIVSDHRAIPLDELVLGLGWLTGWASLPCGAAARPFLDYATQCMDLLKAELDAQQATGREPRRLTLPPCDADTLEGFARSLPNRQDRPKALDVLLEVAQQPVRAINTGQGGAYVAYEVCVPPDLQRVAVLDASFPIRELENMDKTIKADPRFDGRVKSYGNVAIHYAKHKAGRSAIERDMHSYYETNGREGGKMAREVATIIKDTIPQDEAVLVFTFKARSKRREHDVPTILRNALDRVGVDLSATITTTMEGRQVQRPRVNFLTFGSETSLSEFSYCQNVVFAGVLFRANEDLAAAIVGQRDDLLATVSPTDINRVRQSEAAHTIYQGLSRGSCRVIENGEAKAMKAWVAHPYPAINDLLALAMPGVRFVPWKTSELPEPAPGVIRSAAEKIAAYLRGLPGDVREVSSKRLKVEAGMGSLPTRAFTRARAAAEALVPWRVNGRSLVRVF